MEKIDHRTALEDAMSILHGVATSRGAERITIPFTVADQVAAADALARVCIAIEENLLLREDGIFVPVHPPREEAPVTEICDHA